MEDISKNFYRIRKDYSDFFMDIIFKNLLFYSLYSLLWCRLWEAWSWCTSPRRSSTRRRTSSTYHREALHPSPSSIVLYIPPDVLIVHTHIYNLPVAKVFVFFFVLKTSVSVGIRIRRFLISLGPWIRINNYFYRSGSGSFYQKAKKWRKNDKIMENLEFCFII